MGGCGSWGRSAGRRAGVLACFALGCAAALPAASQAESVGYVQGVATTIDITADPGETNALTVNGDLAPTLTLIRDKAAKLKTFGISIRNGSETHCSASGHQAECWSDYPANGSFAFYYNVFLGDGNDYASIVGGTTGRLYGGAGNDILYGGDGPDQVYGDDWSTTPGDDYIDVAGDPGHA